MTASEDFIRVEYPEPHRERTKQIMQKYPEMTRLFGFRRISLLYIIATVALQIGIAYWLGAIEASWWFILIVAFCVGAVANHAMFIMIHEASHDLVLKKTTSNYFAGMLANLPIIVPAAIAFRRFHLLHHAYQGEFERDADLAGPDEAKWVGNSTVRKALWVAFFFIVEGVIRPRRLRDLKLFDKWVYVNLAVEVAFVAVVLATGGWIPLFYMFISTVFAAGPHPLGMRWIQEHYTVAPPQETYSYYGPFNKVMFNVGYHNEHHDLMRVPWMNLPKVRAMAPEYYDNLVYHQSYWALLWKFLFDPKMSLRSRVVRPDGTNKEAMKTKKVPAQEKPASTGPSPSSPEPVAAL